MSFKEWKAERKKKQILGVFFAIVDIFAGFWAATLFADWFFHPDEGVSWRGMAFFSMFFLVKEIMKRFEFYKRFEFWSFVLFMIIFTIQKSFY